MPFTTSNSAFWAGVRSGAPFIIVVGPFGMLFGVLAAEAGLDIVQIMVFTATVFAGAAQFTALQMMQDNAPTLIVLASALAVNLRCAMYSAALTPYLGAAPIWQRALAAFFIVDQSYACSLIEYERNPRMTLPQRMGFFFGVMAPIVPFWYFSTLLGAVLGTRIPESWALDFALPIMFLAMLGPMLRTPAHMVAALVSTIAALLTTWVPHNLGLLVAGALGMMAGAQAELMIERRKVSQ